MKNKTIIGYIDDEKIEMVVTSKLSIRKLRRELSKIMTLEVEISDQLDNALTDKALDDTDRLIAMMKANGHVFEW